MERQVNDTLKDRIVGCMVGGAVGDALGYAVEFDSRRDILRKYGEKGITRYELDPKTGKALISDDTQMSLFTAAGCLLGMTRGACRGIMGHLHGYCGYTCLNWLTTQNSPYERVMKSLDGDSMNQDIRVDTWLMRVPELYSLRAPGNTCLSALESIARGREPKNDSCGCGGVMRTAPIALICSAHQYGGNSADEAAQAARITHKHPLGFIPSAMLDIILRFILESEDAPKDAILNAVLHSIQTIGSVCNEEEGSTYAALYPKHVRTMVDLMNKAVELTHSQKTDAECIRELGEGWTGHEAVAIAVFCALRHPDSFEDAVVAAVNHDGDSDSTGAVCGNIMGALLGRLAIPDHYTSDLEIVDVIEEMAEDLYTGCVISEYCEYDTAAKYRWRLMYMDRFYWEPKDRMISRIKDGSLFRDLGWKDWPKGLR